MKALCLFLIFSLIFPHQSFSATSGKYSLGFDGRFTPDQGQSNISEYVFQGTQNEVLIPVFLLGAVTKPGLYHVPINTDIFSLLALAGGPIKEAELEHIQIKHRTQGDEPRTSELNLEKVVASSSLAVPTLALNDVVLIPTKEPTISNNAVVTIGIIATLAGVILTGVLVSQALKK